MSWPDEAPSTPPPPADALPRVERSEIGPVPAFWSEHEDAPFTATLAFRVGEADERLGTHGRCLLLAGLVLPDEPQAEVAITTSVTTLRTCFTVTGPADAAGAALSRIARSIATLRTDHAGMVIDRVLAAWNPVQRWDLTLMAHRFGSRSYGLGGFPLLGLRYPDLPAFEEWARTWFTAQNAVVSANHRPPSSLDLHALGEGTRKVLPEAHEIERSYPALVRGADQTLAVSFFGPFDPVAELAVDLLVGRMASRLAAFDVAVGPPSVVTRHTGSNQSTVTLEIVAPNELVDSIRQSLSAEIFSFGMNGPSVDELDQARIALRRSRPSGDRRNEEREARAELFGEALDLDAALLAPAEALAAAVRRLSAAPIWLLPRDVPIEDQRVVPVGHGTHQVTDGETHTVAPGATGDEGAVQLIAGAAGITSHFPNGSTSTVLFADAVALEHHPDGGRTLWGDDGTALHLDPQRWPNGQQLVAWIDQCVDPWLILGAPTEDEPPPPPGG